MSLGFTELNPRLTCFYNRNLPKHSEALYQCFANAGFVALQSCFANVEYLLMSEL
ncbi:hypothetical protein HMPREF1584_00882 [Gardnerella vaginalis JCP8481A]|nr:hypothetical protein HMPREF1584_00882 [Gardnerella vaginalis JCP8481A]EPI43639.1 hypothetical protein HMPREF1585_00394 [Gardnerella vaginalis JCP8481B]